MAFQQNLPQFLVAFYNKKQQQNNNENVTYTLNDTQGVKRIHQVLFMLKWMMMPAYASFYI